MGFYTGLVSVARNLIKSKGALISFTRESNDSFDPATGATSGSTASYTAYGITLNYNKSEINGTTVLQSDIKLIMEGIASEPLAGDLAVIDGAIYRCLAVKPTKPAGTSVIYEVQLRL